MNTTRTVLVALLALLAGCAGQRIKLSEDHRRTLTEVPVHAVHFVAQGGFMVESTGYSVAGMLFGPLVIMGQEAEGEEMRSSLGIEDPVVRVKERVLADLEAQYKLPNVVRVEKPLDRLRYRYDSLTGVVFEVRTTEWGIDNNRAKYAASVRVLRLADQALLWDAVCDTVIADKDKPSPTIEALRADNGALLKAKLNQAADVCADQLAGWAIERAERR